LERKILTLECPIAAGEMAAENAVNSEACEGGTPIEETGDAALR
jgi:hypothetical protein